MNFFEAQLCTRLVIACAVLVGMPLRRGMRTPW